MTSVTDNKLSINFIFIIIGLFMMVIVSATLAMSIQRSQPAPAGLASNLHKPSQVQFPEYMQKSHQTVEEDQHVPYAPAEIKPPRPKLMAANETEPAVHKEKVVNFASIEIKPPRPTPMAAIEAEPVIHKQKIVNYASIALKPPREKSVDTVITAEVKKESPVIKISNFPVRRGFLSSRFGMRIDPIHGHRQMHFGIDIAARSGTDVNPMGNGKVVFSGYKAGYGKTIEIKHGHSVVTRYAHLKELLVDFDQLVTKDDVIGLVGNSGRSTGPHLHLEVSLSGNKVDPATFLAGIAESKPRTRPKTIPIADTRFVKVSYQDYLQSVDGLYGLRAPDQTTQYR